jgi:ketosteroid isomerase-like protein
MEANLQFAKDAFDAITQGNTDWLTAHMHEDVVFHQGGHFPTAGTYEGRDAVFGHMMEFFALVEFTFKMHMIDVAASADRAMMLVRVEFDYKGHHCTFDESHIWRIEDGLAVEMYAAPLDPYAVDAFFEAAA